MRKDYIDKELDRILNETVEIPQNIMQRIEKTCNQCHIEEDENKDSHTFAWKKKGLWKMVAAIVAVCLIGTTGVMAATGVFSANKKVKDKQTTFDLTIDKEAIAHDVTVTPNYIVSGFSDESQSGDGDVFTDSQAKEAYLTMLLDTYPEVDESELRSGFEIYQELQISTSQMFNYAMRDANGNFEDGYNIYVYNAKKIDNIMDNWEGNLFAYQKIESEEETRIQNLDTRIFTYKTESGYPVEEILMFNTKEGFIIQITWGLDGEHVVAESEMKKVAEGLQIDILDEKISYLTDEEKAESAKIAQLVDGLTQGDNREAELYEVGVSTDAVSRIGDTFVGDSLWAEPGTGDASYTIMNVSVQNAISVEQYGLEHFWDYEDRIAKWVNEDGTLKVHDRLCTPYGSVESTEETGISSKYVIVKVKEKNNGMNEAEMAIPKLMSLIKSEDGHYNYPQKNYTPYGTHRLQGHSMSVTTANDPIYFSNANNYVEVKGETVWGDHILSAGEEKEYTLIYVVDDDQLSNMVLTFDTLKMQREFVDISQ